jgi:hypothetical protein
MAVACNATAKTKSAAKKRKEIMGKYPRFGSQRKHKQLITNEKCDCCDGPRYGWVDVQFGYMRGSDDERYFVCENHFKMAWKNLKQFLNDAEGCLQLRMLEKAAQRQAVSQQTTSPRAAIAPQTENGNGATAPVLRDE